MKQKFRKILNHNHINTKSFLLLLLGLAATPVLAVTSVGYSCPEKFIATVTNVVEVPTDLFPKVEVDFQVIQTIKGDEVASRKIQVVKDGPVQFKSGETYTLELRDNYLCSATPFSKS
jgi:hypothetical protein